MPHISYDNKEIAFKLVYCGPGLSGKTTNLARLHTMLAEHVRSKMISLDTAEERTLFFDFCPIEIGTIEGYRVRFNMYTVPGQIYYEASRRLILDGADGVVFVADSQRDRIDDNIISFELMQENLRSYHIDVPDFPLVLQYNKRDCAEALPIGTLEAHLHLANIDVFEAVATEGVGVMETVRCVCRRMVNRFQID
jgi:signal recognition particle receptor subunit beta